METVHALTAQTSTFVSANAQSIGVGVALVLITAIAVIYQRRQARGKILPPVTPDTLWENAARTGFVSLPHKVCASEWVADHTAQDVSQGATFRLHMPIPYHFIVTADYALSRLILAGDAGAGVREQDKSPGIKNINLFPSVDNILT